MVKCQLKAVTSDRAVKHEELPIRAMQKFMNEMNSTMER
jgi:hypothetical protein